MKTLRACPSVLALGALAALAGCATQNIPPAPLSSATAAAEFAARSLSDPDLQRFLADNGVSTPPGAWDFETLSWVSFYYHPSLAIARAQWAEARAAAQTAGARPNPTLALTPGYNFTREAGVSPWMPAINFDFLLPTGGKRARQQDIARANAEAARLGVFAAAWQIRSELRRALTDAAIAARRATLLRKPADLQRNVVARLEQRREAGAASVTEVSTARAALLRAEAVAADAATQAATARARVAAALGLPLAALENVALPAPAVAPPLNGDALAAARRASLQSRADVLAALAKYEAAQATLALELAKQTPDFHLGPGYQWDQGGNKWTLALTFELPVFNRNEGPIAEAVARRAEAAAQFTAVQAQALAAIDAATAAQAAAAAQLDHARQLRAEVAAQAARARQRRESGAGDQLEVQTAELDVATADTLVLEAENSAALAAGQLEDALQIPFPRFATLAPSAPAGSP
jgi:outer membrane protein TolC